MSLRREVYFLGSDLASVQGRGVSVAASACLEGRLRASPVSLPAPEGEITLPYCAIDDGLHPEQRIEQVIGTALAQAMLPWDALRRTAVFIGTSSGDIGEHERSYARARVADREAIAITLPWQGEMAERVARRHGLGGPRYSFSTACSAGANALLYAAWMIRSGRLDHALVLGVESQNRMSLLGFSGMLLATRGTCRPFDAERSGILLGEAVAATVLGANPAGNVGWRLAGGATLCDIGHPTNPAPAQIEQTLRAALDDAQMRSADIVAIKAHGTGTPGNDLGEGLGTRDAFDGEPPPFTSIKPVLGHTLGACGVVETLVMQACLDAGALPGTSGFETVDPAIGLAPQARTLALARGPLLLNYFGFGGNDCSLVVAPC